MVVPLLTRYTGSTDSDLPLLLRTEDLALFGASFKPWTAHQVYAVRHCWEDSIEAICNGRWLSWQIDNQRLTPHPGNLPRQNSRWHDTERRGPHEFAKPWHQSLADCPGRFRRHVAGRRASAACRKHEAALLLVTHAHDCFPDAIHFVWHDFDARRPFRAENAIEPFANGWTTTILVLAAASAIRDGQYADA